MSLSVITVTWNSEKLIAEQIRSVFGSVKNLAIEEIVVDNGSSDQTVAIVKSFPNVKLITNVLNKGFAGANNQGLKLATGKWLLFLNPDMRLSEGSLDKLVEWLEQNPQVGIVSPKLVDENNQVNLDASPRRFPTFLNQLAVLLKLPHLFPKILANYLMRDFDFSKCQEVDSVRGSFMLMRRELVEKLGFAFDPRYFFWFEDVDICREAKRLGYTVMYNPLISAVDYVGQSVKQRDSLWKQKQFSASMLVYFKKWAPRWQYFILFIIRKIVLSVVYLKVFLSGLPRPPTKSGSSQ